MKHNPDADHTCLQPCMMLEVGESFQNSPNKIVADRGQNFVWEMVGNLFDTTRRDLCFGGYAPWERELTETKQ